MLSGMSKPEKQQEKGAAVNQTRPYVGARLALCSGQLSSNDSPLGLAPTKAALRFASGDAAASAHTLRTGITHLH